MQFYSLFIDDDALASYAQCLGFPEKEEALHALGNLLALQPPFAEHAEARLALRATPQAVIGIWGDFEKDQEAELEIQAGNINQVLPRLIYVGYPQAEKDCERLAEQLIARFGKSDIAKFKFRAIPRGGYIVLGMLSYLLGLRPSQLQGPTEGNTPLVLVDDCALTGGRFGVALNQAASERVVFAHLYSPPALREAIEGEEAQVVACISAGDLQTLETPEGKQEKTWEARLRQLEGKRYWGGTTQFVCFPWNEPDRLLWNATTSNWMKGWRIVPPELCLKNRELLGTAPIPVQVQKIGRGRLRPSRDTIYHQSKETVLLSNLETKATACLKGSGAHIWETIIRGGNSEKAINQLLKEYEVDEVQLRADFQKLVDELLHRGFLEAREGSDK